MSKDTITNWYSDYLKGWKPGELGEKPTAAQFEIAHKLGARPGTKVSMALAMYLRKSGATTSQVTKCTKGGPQLNKLRNLIALGAVKEVAVPRNSDGHKVYAVTLGSGKVPATPKKQATKEAGTKKQASGKKPVTKQAGRKRAARKTSK